MEKRIIKFRAWNYVAKKMYYPENAGNIFLWQKERQVQDIMQFTGLHDKNGKEIYESDFDQFGRVVKFYRGAFIVENKHSDNWAYLADCEDFEVSGNIYELK
jgi:YopX protein